MVTFKMLTPDALKVIVFNDYNIEVVPMCGKHDDAFAERLGELSVACVGLFWFKTMSYWFG